MRLHGKTAIVTGGAGGIGYAIAQRFLREGARVVIADIDLTKGQEAAKLLERSGEIRFQKTDVAKRLDVHNLVAATLESFGDIDILVNNAGVVHRASFLDVSEDDFDRVLRVNLKGSFLCGQAAARYMVEKVANEGSPGCIINMSSINDTVAIPTEVPYSISKGGISQLTKVMALGLAQYGIRVNAIGPGSVMTDMLTAATDPGGREAILSRTPLGRIGSPDEIAAIAVFLASEDAAYVTGQTIYADGGRLALNGVVAVAADV